MTQHGVEHESAEGESSPLDAQDAPQVDPPVPLGGAAAGEHAGCPIGCGSAFAVGSLVLFGLVWFAAEIGIGDASLSGPELAAVNSVLVCIVLSGLVCAVLGILLDLEMLPGTGSRWRWGTSIAAALGGAGLASFWALTLCLATYSNVTCVARPALLPAAVLLGMGVFRLVHMRFRQ